MTDKECTCGWIAGRDGSGLTRIPDPNCPVHKGS